MNKKLFFVGLILAASGFVSPPFALLGGLVYGLTLTHPFHVESKRLAKFLLQASVVALGFGMNLHEVLRAGRSGFVYTALSITTVMLLGLALGRLAQMQGQADYREEEKSHGIQDEHRSEGDGHLFFVGLGDGTDGRDGAASTDRSPGTDEE